MGRENEPHAASAPKDYGVPTATLLDVLQNDCAAVPEALAALDAAGLLERLVAAEQAGRLDDASYEALLQEFLAPLWHFGIEVRGPNARPPALTPPTCSCEDGTVTLTFRQFVDDSALRLLQERAADIGAATLVRVDVTEASEGALGNAYGLLALLFARPTVLSDLMGPRETVSRYTARNGACRLQQIARLAEFTASDEDAKCQLALEASHVRECTEVAVRRHAEATGTEGASSASADRSVWVRENELYEPLSCPTAPEGVQVTLMAGPRTAAAAEQVVAIARKAVAAGVSNVRIEGDPSGRARYSNLLEVPLCDGFSLVYPMTKEVAGEAAL